MPIYEYQCEACGQRLEALQKISDAPLTECPECGKPALRKLISAAGFRLKGGGWYETDFKSGSKRHLADSGEKPAAETRSGEGKTESKDKPAADKATKPASGADKPAKAASGTGDKSGAKPPAS